MRNLRLENENITFLAKAKPNHESFNVKAQQLLLGEPWEGLTFVLL